MGKTTLEYLLDNADKLKELSNIFLGFVMSLAFLVAIGAIIYFGYKVVKEFKAAMTKALKEMTDSIVESRKEMSESIAESRKETSEAMRELKDAVNGVREIVAEFRGDINAHSAVVVQTREAIILHDGHFSAHDERSRSIKEIGSEAYEAIQEVRCEMATKADAEKLQSGLSEVNKSVTTLERTVAVAFAKAT